MNENKRLLKNTGIIAVGNLSTRIVSFLLLPLYTSVLSTSEYGTVDYITSIAIFCVPFISILMDESMFRFLIECETEFEKKKIISISVMIVFIGSIFFLIVCMFLLLLINYEYTYYLIAYVLASVLTIMISALLRGIGRTDKFAIYNFVISFCNIFLNIILILVFNMGVKGMLLSSIVSQVMISVYFLFNLKIWNYITLKAIDITKAKEMITYSIPLIPNKISWTIINISDRIIIMNYLGVKDAGIYAVSNKFPSLMDTCYGFFYQSWKESSARVLGNLDQNQFYNSVYRYLKDFMYSLALCMIAFMPLIFKLLVNEKFFSAIKFVPFLLISTYFSNISGFYGGIFTAYKDTKIMGITTIVSAIINLLVNLLLINSIGIYAAVISTLLANYIVYLYRKRKVKKYSCLLENKKRQFVSIIITILITYFIYTENFIMIVGGCIISTIYAFVFNFEIIKLLFKIVRR